MMVAFAPQTLALEPEKTVQCGDALVSLCGQRLMQERRGLSPSAFRVNPRGTEVPRYFYGSGGWARTSNQVVNSHLLYH